MYDHYCQFEQDGYNSVEKVRILDTRGYLRYVEKEASGDRVWVDYKDLKAV